MGRKTITPTILLIFLLVKTVNAQHTAIEELYSYTHGVRIKEALLLNIKGYEIIVDKVKGDVSKRNFQTLFKGFGLSKKDMTAVDTSLGIQTFHISKQQTIEEGQSILQEYFFLQKNPDTILGISITAATKTDPVFVKSLFEIITQYGFPDSLISNANSPTFQFAGRAITIDSRCKWRGSNVIQCSGLGEINWSLHSTFEEALSQTTVQESDNKNLKVFKQDNTELVPVLFEGTPTEAKKISFKVKGLSGALTKMEGSRNLIVYYITAPIRGRFVSCVLSHWTSDDIEAGGLPPLLGQLMELKK